MSTDLSVLQQSKSLASSELYQKALEKNKELGSSGPSLPRISIRGSRFRRIIGGEQVEVSNSNAMNIIVVNFSPVVRTYYEGSYDPDKPMAPACWSDDAQGKNKVPSKNVPEPQHVNCLDCPKNMKGSGQGDSRACKYSQRFAVVIEGQTDTVYQLSVPATSLFGEAENGRMPMMAYGGLLKANGSPIQALVTEMSFDENSDTPKLFFRPVRALEVDEFEQIMGMQDTPEVKNCIEMTVSQADGVQKLGNDKPAEKPKAEAPKTAPAKTEEPEIEEPKVAKKSQTEETPKTESDVADILDDWDDED